MVSLKSLQIKNFTFIWCGVPVKAVAVEVAVAEMVEVEVRSRKNLAFLCDALASLLGSASISRTERLKKNISQKIVFFLGMSRTVSGHHAFVRKWFQYYIEINNFFAKKGVFSSQELINYVLY